MIINGQATEEVTVWQCLVREIMFDQTAAYRPKTVFEVFSLGLHLHTYSVT